MPAKLRSCCLLSKNASSSSLDLCRWQWTEAEVSSNSSSTTASTITPSMRHYHYTAINLVESKREKLESEQESLSLWYKGDVISYSSSSIRRRLSSLIIVHTMPVISVQNLNKFIKRWWWWRITGYRGGTWLMLLKGLKFNSWAAAASSEMTVTESTGRRVSWYKVLLHDCPFPCLLPDLLLKDVNLWPANEFICVNPSYTLLTLSSTLHTAANWNVSFWATFCLVRTNWIEAAAEAILSP